MLAGAVLALLSGCAGTGPAATLSPADRDSVARIQSALDSLHGLGARFVQIGADGATSAGLVRYDPGCLRLDYTTPSPMVVVASGQRLVAHRQSDDSTTRIALSGNPLGLLLAQPLRLGGPIQVTDIRRAPRLLQVSLARTANPAEGLLTLVFSEAADGLMLRGLEVVDQRGARTRFDLFDERTGLSFAPELFSTKAVAAAR